MIKPLAFGVVAGVGLTLGVQRQAAKEAETDAAIGRLAEREQAVDRLARRQSEQARTTRRLIGLVEALQEKVSDGSPAVTLPSAVEEAGGDEAVTRRDSFDRRPSAAEEKGGRP